MAVDSGMTVREAAKLPPEDQRMASLIDIGIWSDETEMLAKIYSLLLSRYARSSIAWEKVLPVRYLSSANLAKVRSAEERTQIRRNLSRQLDSLVKMFQ